MTQPSRWPPPRPGDIVWCHFPQDLARRPGPKPRPGLVLAVGEVKGETALEVAFGTSQKTNRLYPGEFLIAPDDGDAFRTAGLSYPTKFDLRKSLQLPYTAEWFAVAPGTPFGQTPKLGLLHPGLIRRARMAFESRRR